MVLKNKKAVLTETIIFLVLTLVFIIALMLFIYRLSTGATLYEQAYAKKIALTIDNMKPGTEVSLFVPQLYSLAEKNNLSPDQMIGINFKENKIRVTLVSGKGYEHICFTPLKSGMVNLDINKYAVIIKV